MGQKGSERLKWAVEQLGVQADEELLEIGCGHGVAVSLVCEKLKGGTITAIDRSQTMIEMAAKRNDAYVAAGKAILRCVALEAVEFERQQFDKIFAIRVNFFIQQPDRQLPVIKSLLKPGGALYLFYDPPVASQLEPLIVSATNGLEAHGFVVEKIVREQVATISAFCIVARPR